MFDTVLYQLVQRLGYRRYTCKQCTAHSVVLINNIKVNTHLSSKSVLISLMSINTLLKYSHYCIVECTNLMKDVLILDI